MSDKLELLYEETLLEMQTSYSGKSNQYSGDEVISSREVVEALRSPSISDWVKTALTSALKRDPNDAHRDARMLLHLLKSNMENNTKFMSGSPR